MGIFIAFFRGINVGGKNILLMKDLTGIMEDLGYKNIKTYIQSGNAIFLTKNSTKDKIAEEMGVSILTHHGFKPKILLITENELREAIKNNPFSTDNGKMLHFFFLDAAPANPDLERLAALKSASEEYKLLNNTFYLYAPDGIGRSKLAAKAEQYLGVPATARNWNTVGKIFEMLNTI